MKKHISIIILVLLLIIGIPAYSAGVMINPNNGDVAAFFSDLLLDESAEGDVFCFFCDADIKAPVEGDLVVIAGDLKINSEIMGNVICLAGKVYLKESAFISGDMVCMGDMDISPEAVINGEITVLKPLDNKWSIDVLRTFKVFWIAIISLLILIAGFALISIYKSRFESIGNSILDKAAKKSVIGFLIYTGLIIILIPLSITIIYPILFFVTLIISGVFSSLFIGMLILKTFNFRYDFYIQFISGLFTVILLKLLLIYSMRGDNLFPEVVILIAFETLVNSVGFGILIGLKQKKLN